MKDTSKHTITNVTAEHEIEPLIIKFNKKNTCEPCHMLIRDIKLRRIVIKSLLCFDI